MTSEQIAEAERLAHEFKPRAALDSDSTGGTLWKRTE
jgi:hypothetical protein